MRLLLTAFFFEAGLVLVIVPWSIYWERNYFADLIPLLHAITTNNFVRGAISGLGVVNLVAALAELRSLLAARRVRSADLSIHRSSVVED